MAQEMAIMQRKNSESEKALRPMCIGLNRFAEVFKNLFIFKLRQNQALIALLYRLQRFHTAIRTRTGARTRTRPHAGRGQKPLQPLRPIHRPKKRRNDDDEKTDTKSD